LAGRAVVGLLLLLAARAMLLSSIKSLHGLPLEVLKSITVFSTLRSLKHIEKDLFHCEENFRN
jgi:hypothetical protein